MKKLTTKDLIMLFLAAKGRDDKMFASISGRTRLMKMIFLFKEEFFKEFTKDKNLGDVKLPDFTPYDYGPFSAEVYEALEWLVNMEFVSVLPEHVALSDMETESKELEYWMITSGDDGGRDRFEGDVFALSEQGEAFYNSVVPGWGISDSQMELLARFKKRCTEISLSSLLHYVYHNYPEMTNKSRIRDEVLK